MRLNDGRNTNMVLVCHTKTNILILLTYSIMSPAIVLYISVKHFYLYFLCINGILALDMR